MRSRYTNVCQAFFHEGTPKIILHIKTLTEGNIYRPENIEAAGSAWNLLQYRQLAEKKSCDISRDIWNFSRNTF
jgi:hypothetical protein